MTRDRRNKPQHPPSRARRFAAGALGAFLLFAGTSHLSFARKEFAQLVPDWVPLDKDDVVVQSGVVEIALGAGLLTLPASRARLGMAIAMLFIAVFPGNLDQFMNRKAAFGLDSDTSRLTRLAAQPFLVLWALWSTGAWRELRPSRSGHRGTSR
jgi:Predicted membrane protein